MSTINPTALRIGMSGSLFDRTYKICGRVVLFTEADGERYTWNEFSLKTSGGEEATLVFEEDESGPLWRFFQFFEPQQPFSIVNASRVSLGDTVQIDDFTGEVDYVGKSTVCAIEGEAPEGVEKGDYSQYFNATGKTILVVSWSGGEVEHYVGQTITRDLVRQAFGVELPASYKAAARLSSGDEEGGGLNFGKIIGWGAAAVFIAFQFANFLPSCSKQDSSDERPPPAAKLEAARSVTLGGRSHRVTRCALVEYATASFTRRARLYDITDDAGRHSQLLQGIENDEKKWTFWDVQTAASTTSYTPQKLAALQAGATIQLEGKPATVATLFRLRVLRVTAGTTETLPTDKLSYGFIAKTGTEWLVVKWNDTSVQLCKMQVMSDIH